MGAILYSKKKKKKNGTPGENKLFNHDHNTICTSLLANEYLYSFIKIGPLVTETVQTKKLQTNQQMDQLTDVVTAI